VKIAIVGTGGVATRHLGVLQQLPSLELVGHLSADRARADAQAAQWGGKAFTELEHMLDSERPDAVWVCVTPDRHGQLEDALIARNVPFFVEKPLAADLTVPEDIAAQLERTSLVVGVGYKFRALDTLPLVREMLAEFPAHMALAAWHDRTPAPSWWRDASRSGGQVVEQATHLVDLARVLLGDAEVVSALSQRAPRQAFPDSTVDEVTAALLRFPRNVPVTLTATCLLDGSVAAHLQLICEGRVLTLSERSLLVQTGQTTREISSQTDPFLAEDSAFVEAVRVSDPTAVLCTYADALRTHQVCITIRDLAQRINSPSR
jgi:predicted dehydrogenase